MPRIHDVRHVALIICHAKPKEQKVHLIDRPSPGKSEMAINQMPKESGLILHYVCDLG